MNKIIKPFYIDTTPGQADMFSPPISIRDYLSWFINRYHASLSHNSNPSRGIAQKVISFMNHQKASEIETPVMIHGPHAKAAAKALSVISHGSLKVKVIEHQKDNAA